MKLFAGLNVWALPIAAIAGFLFGGLWYGMLSKAWLTAVGRTEQDIKNAGRSMPYLFAVTIVAQLIMAWILAGLLLHLAKSGIPIGFRTGIATGAFCWIGFVATTLVVNHGYQGAKNSLTLIDGGHWLGVLLIQGAVLGLWGLA